MRAAYLTKYGSADKVFDIRETAIPEPAAGEIRIKVHAFGLNFADVMARLGLYPEAPKNPAILGYDVVGYIDAIGAEVHTTLKEGDHVLALSRFGGYAEYVCTDHQGVVPIAEGTHPAQATALATQGGTATYMSEIMTTPIAGDHVLVHAAAGGVGSILCQILTHKGAIVYGTAGSSEKLEYLSSLGVHHPINYREKDFKKEIQAILKTQESPGIDIVYDAVGGKSVRNGLQLLGSGGRMVLFGAAALTNGKTVFSKLGVVLGFGIYSPLYLLSNSKSLIGTNMLKIADEKPHVLQHVLKRSVKLFEEGILQPKIGGVYPIDELAQAHEALEKRKTMGKMVITW